jgi:hypothetical protein
VSEEAVRRTKRRYAHELYPHGEEFEVRQLEVEVPYLYARAIGFQVWGTSWFDSDTEVAREQTRARTLQMIDACHIALMADAMHQGLTGQEAWAWAESRMDESGEWVYQRAVHYGVDPALIKPYQCGPEPDSHDHDEAVEGVTWTRVHRIQGKESECPDCTEPVEAPSA